jgi:photosystem II stability/assembly factor-like uncharacterized protein
MVSKCLTRKSGLAAAVCGALLLAGSAPAQAQGLTVAELAKRTHFHGLAVDPARSDRLLLATHHGLFALERDGSARQVSKGGDDYMGFSAHPKDGVTLYSSGHPSSGGNLGFLVSTDGGQSWTQLSAGANGAADFHAMTVSPADPSRIYGTYHGLQVSRDGGKSWEVAGPGPEEAIDIAASAHDPDLLYAGTNTGLMRSTDGGRSWERSHPAEAPVSLVVVGNDGTVFAHLVGTGLLRAREPELDWETLGTGLDGQVLIHLAIDPKDPSRLYAVAVEPGSHRQSLVASSDGGASWSSFPAD